MFSGTPRLSRSRSTASCATGSIAPQKVCGTQRTRVAMTRSTNAFDIQPPCIPSIDHDVGTVR